MSEISREEVKSNLEYLNNCLNENFANSDELSYSLEKAISDMEKLEKIEKGKSDFEELERIMCRYFNMVDISKEKTELEKLALDIVCKGMQTMGCLNGILES